MLSKNFGFTQRINNQNKKRKKAGVRFEMDRQPDSNDDISSEESSSEEETSQEKPQEQMKKSNLKKSNLLPEQAVETTQGDPDDETQVQDEEYKKYLEMMAEVDQKEK